MFSFSGDQPGCVLRVRLRSDFLPAAAAARDGVDASASQTAFVACLTQLVFDKFPTTRALFSWHNENSTETMTGPFEYTAEGPDTHVCQDVGREFPALFADVVGKPESWLIYAVGKTRVSSR